MGFQDKELDTLPYQKRPLQCVKCLIYGDIQTDCKSAMKCRMCAKPTDKCTSSKCKPYCINCKKQGHLSLSNHCKSRQQKGKTSTKPLSLPIRVRGPKPLLRKSLRVLRRPAPGRNGWRRLPITAPRRQALLLKANKLKPHRRKVWQHLLLKVPRRPVLTNTQVKINQVTLARLPAHPYQKRPSGNLKTKPERTMSKIKSLQTD